MAAPPPGPESEFGGGVEEQGSSELPAGLSVPPGLRAGDRGAGGHPAPLSGETADLSSTGLFLSTPPREKEL